MEARAAAGTASASHRAASPRSTSDAEVHAQRAAAATPQHLQVSERLRVPQRREGVGLAGNGDVAGASAVS